MSHDYEKEIIEMAKDFKHNNYKEKALKELDNVRSVFKLDDVQNIAWIVGRYPDFDHIELKVEVKDQWILRLCVAPEVVLENPDIARGFAEMANYFAEKGAHRE